jgi:hypothetical protein
MSDLLIRLLAAEVSMVHDILAFFINFLIVDPLQGEISKRLAEIRAPQAIIADVRACAEASLPRLADRAMADPAWVLTTAFNVWTGNAAPETVLSTSSPQCDATIKSARAYLKAGRQEL